MANRAHLDGGWTPSRAIVGGILTGLANLVPGVSGGTMLLAAGVYPQCIEALARVSTLRPDRRAVALLAFVAVAAGAVILFAAGWVRDLVEGHRWAAYSLFLGATLGGAPLLWRMIGHPTGRTLAGSLAGFAVMVAASGAPADGTAADGSSPVVLFAVGMAAFAATLLPGLSGGYLLVVSGQYIRILGAVDSVKDAMLGTAGAAWGQLVEAMTVLVPFAAGMLAALAAMSSLIRYLLERQRSLMLGFLLGLLLGAVIGIWPFPAQSPGSRLGIPGAAQLAGSVALTVAGFLATFALSRFEGRKPARDR